MPSSFPHRARVNDRRPDWAYHGQAAFSGHWLDELEYADELRTLADRLFDLGELWNAQAPQT